MLCAVGEARKVRGLHFSGIRRLNSGAAKGGRHEAASELLITAARVVFAHGGRRMCLLQRRPYNRDRLSKLSRPAILNRKLKDADC